MVSAVEAGQAAVTDYSKVVAGCAKVVTRAAEVAMSLADEVATGLPEAVMCEAATGAPELRAASEVTGSSAAVARSGAPRSGAVMREN